ncbi:MAG: hypothetical protein EPO02_01010 [Nitrospirae bacterium]|nr:MAG: hypothetical protein EPO02_01010 [Nitrospirota bacterium]
MVHKDGQYGWHAFDWVTRQKALKEIHKGIDVIGWIQKDGRRRLLDNTTLCCVPLPGIVDWVGLDEDGAPSVVIRHSSRSSARIRFSFFGDLSKILVRKGQRLAALEAVGKPSRRQTASRFFHFGLGYEIPNGTRRVDRFVNPNSCLRGEISVARSIRR